MITKEQIEQSAQEVFDIMQVRATAEQMVRIKDAYALARDAHEGQMRKGGDPYIVHPIAVAKIAAEELELGANVVCAAFLHDVVEDTPYTIEDIRQRFGDDVAFLVDVVTKRKKANYAYSLQVDNFKQILDSVDYDIRALMIKLADRLNNMRTLESMPVHKQMKIAGETDFFYAPLANRLGLYRVRSELENLSFKYRCPQEYAHLEQCLTTDRENTQEDVNQFIHQLETILHQKGIDARIEVRLRKPYSIWRDMHKDHVDFANVEFKHYIRIIYTQPQGWSEKDISLYIYSALTDHFRERAGSVTNYIDNPKSNGYQSFHVKLLSGSGKWEELHISSERMLRISRLGCIDQSNEKNMKQWLNKLRELLKEIATQNMSDFMEGVSSSFFNDDMYIYTPKGQIVLLPQGASVLDFAFELHTDLGLHAQYARINGKLSSVRTHLKRGDCVEVVTHPSILPAEDWLEDVVTYKATKAIKDSMPNLQEALEYTCDCCHPLPGDEVIGFKDSAGHIVIHTRQCHEAIRLASEHGDWIIPIVLPEQPNKTYPIHLQIIAIDCFGLLNDILHSIETLHLSMSHLVTECKDNIVQCTLTVGVHSATELNTIMQQIAAIDNVDTVQRIEQ